MSKIHFIFFLFISVFGRFVQASHENQRLLESACSDGHTEVVKLLLADPGVDPSAEDNWCIRQASSLGQTEVVKLLLADPGVDPSADDNWSILYASLLDQTEIVKLFLADPRVDTRSVNNSDGLGLSHLIEMIEHVRSGNHMELPNFITVGDLDILVGNGKAGTETAKHLRQRQVHWIKLRHPVEVYPGHFCSYLEASEAEREIIRDGFWANVDKVFPLLEALKPVPTEVLDDAIDMLVNARVTPDAVGSVDTFRHLFRLV